MKIDYNFILLLIGIVTGIFSICGYLWKVTKFLGSKSRSVDIRIHSLYDVLKVQSARLSDIAEYLSLPEQTRGSFHKRQSLERLEDSAFKDYNDEHTGFNHK